MLVVAALIALFPLLWMLSASFMSAGESTTNPPHLIPHAATLAQYRQLFVRLNIGRAFLSSAVVAIIRRRPKRRDCSMETPAVASLAR